jgi:tetratricopeptide (TPR) repeat protein
MLGRVGESLRDTKLAIGGYQQAVAVKNLPDADAATIRMLAGEGLARLDLPGDAAVAFAQASQDRGPIGIAAACRLAHMNAKNPSLAGHRKADVETLAKCVAAVKPTGELDNPHVTIDDLRTTCETVIRACVNDGDEASAQQAMGLFEKVGSPARAREVKADALQTLAYATANKPDPSNKAAALHRQAAAEFDALAAASLTPALKVDAMVKAANSFVAAGDRTAARDRLSEIANLPGLPAEQLASIRTSLAETVADPAQAATLLQQVVESGGAAAYAARVKLGEVKLDQANALIGKFADPAVKTQWDRMTAEAATLLEQAATATTVAPADQPAHERAMYLLGRLKLYQGKHSESIGTLKSLLQRYPNAKDAERAKLFLGSSLLVEGTTAPGNAATVTEAIAMLEPLAAGAKDSYVRTQAGLRVARGHLAGGRWQEAITAATATADGSKGTVEELIALSLAYNAYAEQKRPEQLTVVEGRMRQVFQELPETAFNGSADEYRAGYWKTTWFDFFDKKKSP